MLALLSNPLLFWELAAAVTLAIGTWQAGRVSLDPWTMYLAGMAGLGGALLVGWLYVALTEQGFHAESGGRGVVGAFIGAAAFGWLAVRLRGGEFLRYADAAVPGIPLGYAVYRIGCFLNGCCFGIPTDLAWGVSFAPGTEAFDAQLAARWIDSNAARSLSVHPTQLYHAAAGLLIFMVLVRMAHGWPGRRLAFALLAYAVSRFVIEFFRGNAQPVWGALDVNQIFCIAMIALAALIRWSSSRGAISLRERAI